MRQKPIHEIRDGAVKAAIWKNETKAGVRFNVTFRRLYKRGDTWASSDSFGKAELLAVVRVTDMAYTWICANQKSEEKSVAHRAVKPPVS